MEPDAIKGVLLFVIIPAIFLIVAVVVIYYDDFKKWFGWRLTAERARKLADKKQKVKEEKEFEKVLGEILWLSREIGARQMKHAEFDERYVEALRQLGYEVEEEPEPNDITGVKGYRIKW